MSLDRQTHGDIRAGKLTSTMARDLMSRDPKKWKRLSDAMLHPRPFYEAGPNAPAPLRWGAKHEAQAWAEFWEQNPDVEMSDPKVCQYHDPGELGQLGWYLCASVDRIIEFKNPRAVLVGESKAPYNGDVHLKYAASHCVPPEHEDQLYWHGLVTGISRGVFISFDPRAHTSIRLVVRYVDFDPERLRKMRDTARRFIQIHTGDRDFDRMRRDVGDFLAS